MTYISFDHQYINLVSKILEQDTYVTGRDSLKYRQIFGESISVDLRIEFPMLTLRRMPVKNIFKEFMWDVSGQSDVKALDTARHFWSFLSINDWLPASYGSSWRHWPHNLPTNLNEKNHKCFLNEPFDQLKWLHSEIINNPTNRQLVLQTYNPAHNKTVVKCPPCHPTIVFSSDATHLDMLVLGRSWDVATGVPIDVPRYAILLAKMAQDANLIARELKIVSANTHIYDSNKSQVIEICLREPRENTAELWINKERSLFDLDPDLDLYLYYYQAHQSLRMEVAK